MPSPTSTAKRRNVAKPAGLPTLSSQACTSAAFDGDEILLDMRDLLNAGPGRQAEARASMPDLAAKYIPPVRAAITKERHAWIAAAYPANFVTVLDHDRMLAALDRLSAASRAKDLAAVPKIYLDFNSARDQYGTDALGLCKG